MESIERKTKYRHTIRRSCLRCTGIVTMSTSAIPRFHERIGTSFRTCISPFACNYGTFSFCTCRSLPPGAVFSSLSFQRSLQRSPHSLLVIDDSLGCSHAMGNPQRYYRLLANSSTPRNQRDCYSSQGPKYCNRLNPEYYNRFGTVIIVSLSFLFRIVFKSIEAARSCLYSVFQQAIWDFAVHFLSQLISTVSNKRNA